MSSIRKEEIVRSTWIRLVEYHEVLDSTNRLAVELRDHLLPESPALVITDLQTAGRGRGSNNWWSAEGALALTVVLNANVHGPVPEHRPLVALASGLAVRRALQESVPGRQLQTKWPNDVLVDGQKICGILCEQHATSAGELALIVGIGININNSLAAAPDDVRLRATSMFDLTGESFDLTKILVSLLRELEYGLAQLQQDVAATVSESARNSYLTGRRVKVETPFGSLTGDCIGLGSDGALLLSVDGIVQEIRAGSVVAVES